MDFEGDYSAAHNFVDTAGDFILLNTQFENLSQERQARLLDFYSIKWVYPIEDVMEILRLAGHERISKTELKICLNRGLLALKSELGAVLTNRRTGGRRDLSLERSPLFSELLHSYYYGGINQIVDTLQKCKVELGSWLDGHISNDPWDICRPIFKKHDTNVVVAASSDTLRSALVDLTLLPLEDGARYISPMVKNSHFGSSLLFGDYLGEPTIVIGAPFEGDSGSVYMVPLRNIVEFSSLTNNIQSTKISPLSPSQSLPLKYPIRFGSKLASWKIGASNFLVASEPGISTFKVFLGSKLVAILGSLSSNNTMGTKGIKQLDILSSEAVDFDRDGSSDLIIGSPYADHLGFPQAGKVSVVKGSLFNEMVTKHIQSGISTPLNLNIEELVSHKFSLPLDCIQENGYDQFGSSVALTDNFMLVSVGSVGSVAVFDRETSSLLGMLTENGFSSDIKLERATSQQSKLFGHNFIMTGHNKNFEWLLVSQSADSYDECSLCGSAVLFRLQDKQFDKVAKIKPSDPQHGSEITNIFANFASTGIKINDDIVIISSPSYDDGRGALYLVNINLILNENPGGADVTCELVHVGDDGTGFSNFGASMETFAYSNRIFIAIGMPEYGIGYTSEFNALLSGYVKIIELGHS